MRIKLGNWLLELALKILGAKSAIIRYRKNVKRKEK